MIMVAVVPQRYRLLRGILVCQGCVSVFAVGAVTEGSQTIGKNEVYVCIYIKQGGVQCRFCFCLVLLAPPH